MLFLKQQLKQLILLLVYADNNEHITNSTFFLNYLYYLDKKIANVHMVYGSG